MALADNRFQRTLTLCTLYVAQGVPWGFMLITLPTFLAYEYGVGDRQIGELTAIILLPWSFKLIWAPIMDSFTIRSMGRRRPWIIGAEIMMAVTLLGFVGLGDPSQKLRLILVMYFLHNCFASLQDVCTDALAVDVLPVQEHGRMNGLMWGSKLIGKGVGAWALSRVLQVGGIEACVAVQIVLLLLIMLFPLWILERPGERRFPWSAGQADQSAEKAARNPVDVLKSYFRAFSLTTTVVYIFFTLSKLVGVGVNEVITKTLYTQQLTPKWTDAEFSTVAGLYVTYLVIPGSVLAGWLADRFDRRLVLTIGFGGYGVAAIIFAANPGLWNQPWFATSYVLVFELLNAVASIGFVALAMRISWTRAAATVFTTYLTLSNVSHMIGNWLAGPIRAWLTDPNLGDAATLASYRATFWIVGLTALAPLLLLFLVRPHEVDRARNAELSRQGSV